MYDSLWNFLKYFEVKFQYAFFWSTSYISKSWSYLEEFNDYIFVAYFNGCWVITQLNSFRS